MTLSVGIELETNELIIGASMWFNCLRQNPATTTKATHSKHITQHHPTVSVACWPIRPIWGFWGSKVHKNGRFHALDADEPPCKILRS